MATPATIWCTDVGAGAENGESLATAYALADGVAAVNGLGALSQGLTVRICGDCTTAAALSLTKDATGTYRITWQGRNSGDAADAVVEIDADGGAHSVWTPTTADYHLWRHIHSTGTDEAAGHHGWDVGANADYCAWEHCRASHCMHGWYCDTGAYAPRWVRCRADSNSGRAVESSDTGLLIECVGHNNGAAWSGFTGGHHVRAISYVNGYGFYNIRSAIGCIAYGSVTGYGFKPITLDMVPLADCIVVGNAGFGFDDNGATTLASLLRCADYGNSARKDSGTGNWIDVDPINLSADPFVDGANGDFRIDTRKAAGRQLLAAGYPVSVAGRSSPWDIGAYSADLVMGRGVRTGVRM